MKSMRLMLLGGTFLCIGGAAAAAAQPGQDGPPREETRADATARADQMFQRLDANHDGRITSEEVSGAMGARGPGGPGGPGMRGPGGPGGPNGMFDQLDADHNGTLSREEFARMGPPPGGPDGPGGPGMGGGPGGPGMGGRGGGGGQMLARMIGPQGLTADEFRARMLQRFDRLDANHDGRVTGEERQAARARMQEMRAGADGRPEPEGNQ